LTFWGASIVAFGFMRLAPMDPARFVIGFRPGPQQQREEQIRELREWYGLDYPFPVQYARWMGRALVGNFGRSLTSRRDIAPELFRRIPWSLLLAGTSAALAWGLALPLAVAAARGGGAGRASDVVATAVLILPPFLVATLLVYLFAVRLTWIPILPPYELNIFDPSLWEGLLLPTVSLALPLAAIIARQMRQDLRAILRAPYAATARAKGLSERRVVWRHAARVATHAILARPLPLMSVLFSGLLVVEEIYNWPGIGRNFMRGITLRDIPAVQAVLLILTGLVVAGELLTRLAGDRAELGDNVPAPERNPASEAGRASAVRAPSLSARTAVAVVAALAIAAVAAPLLVRFPPDQVLLEEIHLPPSLRHWLGTDSSGRDMFSRLVHAGRPTLGITVGAAIGAVVVGALLTGHTRWNRRWDAVVTWNARAVTALPALAISVAGRTPLIIGAIFAAIGLAGIVDGMRPLLAAARRWPFVEAAVASGADPRWIGERHLLPHLARPLLANAAGLVPGFLILEATLGFLGFSVTPTITTWGTLMWRGREALHRGDWWLLVFPVAFMAAAAWAFRNIAEALGEPPPPTYTKAARLELGKEWGRAPRGVPSQTPEQRPALARGDVRCRAVPRRAPSPSRRWDRSKGDLTAALPPERAVSGGDNLAGRQPIVLHQCLRDP
jgi:peptide/nickel transport system permease protein